MVQGKGIAIQALDGARYLDLLAKTAKTSLKDTRRVLLAIEALEYAFDVSPSDEVDHCLDRPSTAEVTACDRAYQTMFELAAAQPTLRKLLKLVKKTKYIQDVTRCEEESLRPTELGSLPETWGESSCTRP